MMILIAPGCGEKKSSEPGDGPEEPEEDRVTLTVEVCSGVGGGPVTGTYPHDKGDTVDYFYVLAHGYADLVVLLDSVAVPPSGSIILDRDRFLSVMCERKFIWELKLEKQVYYCCPAVGDDGTIYIATKAYGPEVPAKIIALTPLGTKVWEYVVAHTHATEAGDDVYSAPSVGADGTLYFGSENEHFYALNPDGTLKWKCQLGYGINWTSAAILDAGTLYIGSMHSSPGFNGRLWALETESMGYASSPWPRFRCDHRNTGRFGAR